MLNNKITLDQTNSNSMEETKMKTNYKQIISDLTEIYELVNNSKLSKKAKAEITTKLTSIKTSSKQMAKETLAIKKQYVSSIKPTQQTLIKPETKSETKSETKPEKHYYKPNLKFMPKTIDWLLTNSTYPLIIPNQNYVLLKEETPHPDDTAPDLLEYFVVYRPLSELSDKQSERLEYNNIFTTYKYDNTTAKTLLNTIYEKLLAKQSITAEYTLYIKLIDSFKEAVFTHTISID